MNPTRTAGIDDRMTVNEIIALHPDTVGIFNRHRIDACCGGAVPLHDAAVRDGADPDALLAELREVVEGGQ